MFISSQIAFNCFTDNDSSIDLDGGGLKMIVLFTSSTGKSSTCSSSDTSSSSSDYSSTSDSSKSESVNSLI